MNKTLITGASGFIGGQLTRYLIEQQRDVGILVRKNSSLEFLKEVRSKPKIHYYDGTYESIYSAIKDQNYSSVFHLATLFKANHEGSEISDLINSNVTLGAQLAEAMVQAGIHYMVNTSSSWQYYHSKKYNPLNLYAATKKAFEDILLYYTRSNALKVANVILFDTYGETDRRPKLIPQLLKNNLNKSRFRLSPGNQLMDLTHVSQITRALDQAERRIMNSEEELLHFIASSGSAQPLREVIEQLIAQYDLRVDIDWGSTPYRDREVFKVMIYDEFENLCNKRN